MDRKTRQFIKLAIVTCLKFIKEGTSRQIHFCLKNRRVRFRVDPNPRQVAEICSAMSREGILLSRLRGRVKSWRINPDFRKEHAGKRMFELPTNLRELDKDMKRRRKRIPKAKK